MTSDEKKAYDLQEAAEYKRLAEVKQQAIELKRARRLFELKSPEEKMEAYQKRVAEKKKADHDAKMSAAAIKKAEEDKKAADAAREKLILD